MTAVGLLRHLPTDWNAAGRLQGRTDVPLSPASRAGLPGLSLPPGWAGVRVIASPLSRARETAAALAGGKVAVDARLAEMDFGAWEGASGAALLADPASGYRGVEAWGWDFRPPGGESPREVAGRALALLAELAGGPPVLLVTHRGVMRALLALATGWDYAGPEPFRIRRGAVHPVTLDAGGRPVAALAPVRLVVR